jgi:hypothetical protein
VIRARLFALALAQILVLALGCRSRGVCKPGEPFCWCPAGATCTQECSGPTCALYCANGDSTCTLRGGDRATASCQNAQSCAATAGRGSMVACQHVKGSCTATVGDGSRVHCEGAALCDVKCTGDCDVDCPDGHCRVRCADPSRCRVACGGLTGGGATCPDGTTRTCDASCT